MKNYEKNKPLRDSIVEILTAAVSDSVYLSPSSFEPVLAAVLQGVTTDKKLLTRIADGLSVMV